MTTNFLDNKICTFKILLLWRFRENKRFWTIFLSAPKAHPPSKSENVMFIVVSPSLTAKMLVFQDLEGLTEVFGPDQGYPA